MKLLIGFIRTAGWCMTERMGSSDFCRMIFCQYFLLCDVIQLNSSISNSWCWYLIVKLLESKRLNTSVENVYGMSPWLVHTLIYRNIYPFKVFIFGYAAWGNLITESFTNINYIFKTSELTYCVKGTKWLTLKLFE